MKIQVGKIFKGICSDKNNDPLLAIHIPVLGILACKIDKDNEPFQCVYLNKSQLMKLKDEIEEELLR